MSESKSIKKSDFTNLLRQERERRGWTHKDVADRINLPDSHTVSRWERGKSFPRSHYRQELSRLFEKSIEELGLARHTLDKSTQHMLIESDQVPEPLWKVPLSFTPLVGREQEVETVYMLLKRPEVHLVTLLGPGGVGKTRLSIQVVTEARDCFADGVCFISLASIDNPNLVLPTIAATLGLQESGIQPLCEQLKISLEEKKLLILLDGFERVINAASLIEDLLVSCPNLKILITSRIVLHLQNEYQFIVSPLTLPNIRQNLDQTSLVQYASVAYFLQRVRVILPRFKVTQGNMRSIAEICIRLDGLPLAIEMAAAHCKILSPQSLLTRLSLCSEVLESKTFTPLEHHQTIYKTIAWSYNLLEPQEKWLFRRLSVFAGGCTLDIVEAIFHNTEKQSVDIFRTLSSLLDKSLLQRVEREDRELRFTMLETIREYGLESLRMNDELEDIQQTHALYYLALVERAELHLKGAQQATWLRLLEGEQENLRVALRYFVEYKKIALALRFCEGFGKFCGLSGYWSEEQYWLKTVLELPMSSEHKAMRAQILRRAGHLAYRLRDLVSSHSLQEESVALSRELGDKKNLAGALSGLGWTLYRQNNLTTAALFLEESAIVAQKSGDRWTLANSLESRGRLTYYQGNNEAARLILEESVVLSRELGDKESLARILLTLVSIELALGNIARAEVLVCESLALAQELGAKPLVGLVFDSLGDVALIQGNYERAAELFEERIAVARKLNDKPTVALKELHLANIALAQGNLSRASAFVQESLKFFRERDDYLNIVFALGIMGDIQLVQDDRVQALTSYKEAILLHKEIGNKRSISRHLIGIAKIAVEKQMLEYAIWLLGSITDKVKSLYPPQREDYAYILDIVQKQINEDIFEIMWSKSQKITFEQVLAITEQLMMIDQKHIFPSS